MDAAALYRPPNDTQARILRLLAAGHSQTEAGKRVHLTRTGVRWHLDRLRRQWALRSVPQLLILAGQMGWAGVPDREWRIVERPTQRLPKGMPIRPHRHYWKGAA